jgi:hypothetical protein
MSTNRIVWGLKIYLAEEHTQDTDIGLYTSGGESWFRWIESEITGTSETYKTGILAPNGIPAIDEGGDFTRGGAFITVKGIVVNICNAAKFYNDLDADNIGINGLRCDLIEFSQNVSTSVVTETVRAFFKTSVNAWDVRHYKLPLEPNVYGRNAAMGTQINSESYPYAGDSEQGKMIPMTFGDPDKPVLQFTERDLDKITFSYLYPNQELFESIAEIRIDFKYSTDLDEGKYCFRLIHVSPDGTSATVASQWDDIVANPTDYAVKVVFQGQVIDLYNDPSGSPVTDGSINIGKFRRIKTFVYDTLGSGTYAGETVGLLELNNEFEVPLGDSINAWGDSDCFLQFYRINWAAAIDVWPCNGFDDATQSEYLFNYQEDDDKFQKLPADVVESTADDNSVILEPQSLVDGLETLEWWTTRALTSSLGGRSTYRFQPSWESSYITLNRLELLTGGVASGFYGISTADKVDEYADNFDGTYNGTLSVSGGILTTTGGASRSGFGLVLVAGLADLLFADDNEYDSAYICMNLAHKWWSGGDISGGIVVGAFMKDNFTIKTLADWSSEGSAWDYATNRNIPDTDRNEKFWFETQEVTTINTTSYPFGNPVTATQRTGYPLFEIAIDQFKDAMQNLVIIMTNRVTASAAVTFAFDRFNDFQLVLKRSMNVQTLYANILGGRIYDDTWSSRKTDTDVMYSPVDLYEHACRLQNWSDAGDTSIEYGKAYSSSALINISEIELNYDNLAGGNFATGETITGGTSGATGTVHRDNGSDTLFLYNVSGAYENDEQISNGGGVTADVDGTAKRPQGGFDSPRLNSMRAMALSFQVTSFEESFTRVFKEKLLRTIWSVGYINEQGEECLEYLPKLGEDAITDSITLADCPDGMYPGDVVEPNPKNVYCAPFVRYKWNQAAQRFDGYIAIKNTHIDGGWSAEYTPGFSAAEGEEYWDRCHEELWDRYHQMEEPPSNLTDQKYIYRDQDAKLWLTTWIDWMLVRRIPFPVYYEKGSPWHVGKHLYITLPHQTNGVQTEAVIERIVKNKNRGFCQMSLAFFVVETFEYYHKGVMFTQAEGADADWKNTTDTGNPQYKDNM